MSAKLFVGKISYNSTEQTLTEAFSQFGEVVSAKVITDRETGRSRGFAFVEMADDAAAEAAIKGLDGKELDGRQIAVSVAKEREDRGDRGPRRDFGNGNQPRRSW